MRVCVLYFLLGVSAPAFSQNVNRYMVFFRDKAGTPHTLSDPSTYLSPRSLARREKNNTRLSAQDLPVSPDYVERIRALGVETYHTTRWMNGLLVQCTQAKASEIEREDYVNEVVYVAPGRRLRSFVPYTIPQRAAGEDPVYFPTSPENERQLSMIGALAMHKRGYFGNGVLIAVFDGGFDDVTLIDAFDHLFAQQRLVYTYNYVTNVGDVDNEAKHGTSVLSCMAAYLKNIYVGTAYKAQYALFVTEDGATEYRVEEYNWLFAAEKADSLGADIISSSLGYMFFDDQSMNYTYENLNGKTAISSLAATWAQRRGIVVVNSAGNSGANEANPWMSAPCDADSILCIGAVDQFRQRAAFSSVGPTGDDRIKPDVAAMGAETLAIADNAGRASVNGTSFSAPLISGLVAGFMQHSPDKTAKEIREAVRFSAHQAAVPDNLLGYGIPHFLAHTGELISGHAEQPIHVPESAYRLSIYPNPMGADDKLLRIHCTSLRAYTHADFLFYLFDGILQKYDRQALSSAEKEGVFSLYLGDIPPGVYVLKVRLLSHPPNERNDPGAAATHPLAVIHEYEPMRFVVQ